MEKKKCPVCGKEQEEVSYCRQCGWDFTTDILRGEKQQKICEDEMERYHKRLKLLQENFEKSQRWEQVEQTVFWNSGFLMQKKQEFDPEECGFDRKSTYIEIPQGYERIAAGAFQDWKSLQEVRMPDTIREIEECAFYGCMKLSVIGWSKNLTKIGKEAFGGCKGIEELCLPRGVEEVGKRAFAWCTKVKRIVFPDSLKIIRQEAWTGCQELLEVCLPEGMRILEKGAFSYCIKIRKIQIPESLSEIWDRKEKVDGIFEGCRQIKQAVIPDDGNFGLLSQMEHFLPEGKISFAHREEQEDLDFGTFIWRRGTEESSVIRVPYGYQRLGMSDLADQFWMPDSIKEITERFLEPCICMDGKHKIQIKWSQNLKVIGALCCTKINIWNLRLPGSMEEIGRAAFKNCANLKQIYLPNTLKKIGADAFSSCPIDTIIMENGIDAEIEQQMKRRFPTAQYQMVERPEE